MVKKSSRWPNKSCCVLARTSKSSIHFFIAMFILSNRGGIVDWKYADALSSRAALIWKPKIPVQILRDTCCKKIGPWDTASSLCRIPERQTVCFLGIDLTLPRQWALAIALVFQLQTSDVNLLSCNSSLSSPFAPDMVPPARGLIIGLHESQRH